jgi:hypothetical protein
VNQIADAIVGGSRKELREHMQIMHEENIKLKCELIEVKRQLMAVRLSNIGKLQKDILA